MRRSICLCEPAAAISGEVANWKFSYTSAIPLPKGTRLKFELLSQGRDFDWEIPEVASKDKKNMIWAELPGKKILSPKVLKEQKGAGLAFEFTLINELKAGDTILIYLGSPDKNEARKKGCRAQKNVQRRRPFHLYIDPKGKGDYKDPEVFTLDIRGNVLHTIRIIVPSIVTKNKRFDVVVRFEDEFGNLTSNAPEGTLIELSYEHLRENLNWKLFVPETGFINLPNLYFNEPGVYRIQLRNAKTGETFYSDPIKCSSDNDKNLYWGILHGEMQRHDSAEDIEACLRHVRDEKSLQFFASSCFENVEETSNEVWKGIVQQVAEFNEDGRFCTFLGMQWFADTPEEGLRQLIYYKDNKPLLRKKDIKSNSLKKIYKSHTIKELLSIPCFSMAKGFETTFEDFSPEYERVVEIYNAWGSSEATIKEGNLRPILSESKEGINETEKGSVRKALARNCRFGFVAGGLDDRSIYSGLYESDQTQYSSGLTGIFSIEQTREALLQALYNRSCYATTGERIILGFFIAGAQMGSELNTKQKPGLAFNRHITGYVAGTAPLKEIALIRNGSIFHTFEPKSSSFDIMFDDSEPLSNVVLTSPDERPVFAYYYLRVLQEDGHIAWSSPIWIDYPDMAASQASMKKTKKMTPAPAKKIKE
ncbi:MAG: DUF3604 domain-containing protein [Anaerolineae bacterium]